MENQSKTSLKIHCNTGNIYVSIQIRIPDGKSPRFPKKPTIRQDGDILIMECILEAHPTPDITWYRGDQKLDDSPRMKMSRKATSKDSYLLSLKITEPTQEDGGNYRCNAFNTYGESNANIALNFQGIVFICVFLVSTIYLLGVFYTVNAASSCNLKEFLD